MANFSQGFATGLGTANTAGIDALARRMERNQKLVTDSIQTAKSKLGQYSGYLNKFPELKGDFDAINNDILAAEAAGTSFDITPYLLAIDEKVGISQQDAATSAADAKDKKDKRAIIEDLRAKVAKNPALAPFVHGMSRRVEGQPTGDDSENLRQLKLELEQTQDPTLKTEIQSYIDKLQGGNKDFDPYTSTEFGDPNLLDMEEIDYILANYVADEAENKSTEAANKSKEALLKKVEQYNGIVPKDSVMELWDYINSGNADPEQVQSRLYDFERTKLGVEAASKARTDRKTEEVRRNQQYEDVEGILNKYASYQGYEIEFNNMYEDIQDELHDKRAAGLPIEIYDPKYNLSRMATLANEIDFKRNHVIWNEGLPEGAPTNYINKTVFKEIYMRDQEALSDKVSAMVSGGKDYIDKNGRDSEAILLEDFGIELDNDDTLDEVLEALSYETETKLAKMSRAFTAMETVTNPVVKEYINVSEIPEEDKTKLYETWNGSGLTEEQRRSILNSRDNQKIFFNNNRNTLFEHMSLLDFRSLIKTGYIN